MDNERIRAICLALPHVTETLNWGHHLVYWAGDRDIGGKMFAMTDADGTGFGKLWFHCGAERFHELLEIDGMSASPYLAKAHWVTMERWDVLKPREIEDELRRAHTLIFEKLLLVLCWPLALAALVLYPLVWLLLLPFRIVGIAVGGVLELVRGIIFLPGRVLRAI